MSAFIIYIAPCVNYNILLTMRQLYFHMPFYIYYNNMQCNAKKRSKPIDCGDFRWWMANRKISFYIYVLYIVCKISFYCVDSFCDLPLKLSHLSNILRIKQWSKSNQTNHYIFFLNIKFSIKLWASHGNLNIKSRYFIQGIYYVIWGPYFTIYRRCFV